MAASPAENLFALEMKALLLLPRGFFLAQSHGSIVEYAPGGVECTKSE